MSHEEIAIQRWTHFLKVVLPLLSDEKKILSRFTGATSIAKALFTKKSDMYIKNLLKFDKIPKKSGEENKNEINEISLFIDKQEAQGGAEITTTQYLDTLSAIGHFFLRSKYVLNKNIESISPRKMKEEFMISVIDETRHDTLLDSYDNLNKKEQEEFKKVAMTLAKFNQKRHVFLIVTVLSKTCRNSEIIDEHGRVAYKIGEGLRSGENNTFTTSDDNAIFKFNKTTPARIETLRHIGGYISEKAKHRKEGEDPLEIELKEEDWKKMAEMYINQKQLKKIKTEYNTKFWKKEEYNKLEKRSIISCAVHLYGKTGKKEISRNSSITIPRFNNIMNILGKIIEKEENILERGNGVKYLKKRFRDPEDENFYIEGIEYWKETTIETYLLELRIFGHCLLRCKYLFGTEIDKINTDNFEKLFVKTRSHWPKLMLKFYKNLEDDDKKKFREGVIIIDKANTGDSLFFIINVLMENPELPAKFKNSTSKLAAHMSDGFFKFKDECVGDYNFKKQTVSGALRALFEIGGYLRNNNKVGLAIISSKNPGLGIKEMDKLHKNARNQAAFNKMKKYYFKPMWKNPQNTATEKSHILKCALLIHREGAKR